MFQQMKKPMPQPMPQGQMPMGQGMMPGMMPPSTPPPPGDPTQAPVSPWQQKLAAFGEQLQGGAQDPLRQAILARLGAQ